MKKILLFLVLIAVSFSLFSSNVFPASAYETITLPSGKTAKLLGEVYPGEILEAPFECKNVMNGKAKVWLTFKGEAGSWFSPNPLQCGILNSLESKSVPLTVKIPSSEWGIQTFHVWIGCEAYPNSSVPCPGQISDMYAIKVNPFSDTTQKENTRVLKSTIPIYHGVNYQKMKASSDDDSEDVHIWKTISGPQSNWASTKSVDFGILSPGEETGWTHWTINVPSDVPYGEYTFTWTNHCEIVSTGGPCKKTMYIMPYEMTLKPGIPKEKQGGCLIATATYGSELSPQVQQLRELRDNSLLNTKVGISFMNTFNDVYYSFSPVIADYERENPVFKEMVKLTITPMISSLSILNHVDMDSENSVLGYGISLIILNLAMYVGIPIVAIVGIRKKC